MAIPRSGADYQRFLTDAMRLQVFRVPEITSESAPQSAWWRATVEDIVYEPARRLAVIVVSTGQYRLPPQLLDWAQAVLKELGELWGVTEPFPFVGYFAQVDGEFLVDMQPVLGR
ncbi:hypothetical protein ACIGXM_14500 [Kitasatospora sp. NPDC052896]|uniref:hypothetical protein n=1 Tax=Kitasatospora sp. NPDC052896 TaxID=3364061 RepID=UPI0037C751FB